MMKKRIVALLLAGLMSATALASCTASGNNQTGGTEPNQNPPTNQTTPNPNTNINPPAPTWNDVNKYVYTYKDVKLFEEANNNSADLGSIPKDQEVHCTKQSTSWLYVEYDGKQGYVSKTSVIDIGLKFEPINESGSKIMYANAKTVNVRPFPIVNDTYSDEIGSYALNEEVTVVASNGTWYKISYKDGFAYIKGDCLDEQKVTDPNDDSAYRELFEAVADKPVMYVKDDVVNFRTTPVVPNKEPSKNIITPLAKGHKVTVKAKGVVDGKEWAFVLVEILPTNEGDGIQKKEGYIRFDYLSLFADETTLESLLEIYKPAFTKCETPEDMYVVADNGIKIRSTPTFPEKDANVVTVLESTKDSIKGVKVLAKGTYKDTGSGNDYSWYIVEYTEKVGETEKTFRGFVGGAALKALTTDPEGKPTVTLEGFLSEYSDKYSILTTPVTVTTNGVTNCYGAPSNNDKSKELAAGTEVLLVAEEKGDAASWAVIKDDTGYYFVYLSKLTKAE